MDAVTAAKDLQELGVNYTQEQLDQIKQAEEQRLRQRRMEREAKERERLGELYEDCDGRFAFIAGYTDGGAPYGVMWEEVGIDPGLPFEEKVKLYHMQMLVLPHFCSMLSPSSSVSCFSNEVCLARMALTLS